MATSKQVAITQKISSQKGKDVIMYNLYRDHSILVAKATILSIDHRKVVGGQELGSEYCEVAVNYVIKRDAILPRGVGNMTTMGQAQGRCITWPYKHLEVDKSMEKSRNATTSRPRRFPKGTQVDDGLEDFQAPADLEDLQ
ncbi:uncharacterized protein [Aegilops tauschii subsp. strangulata]|uniref:uncharacterized protein n=1 Tax=Aegilops tauschii subsp. strangulata TaxID=200361 RepID=UPI00098A0019|nr:uncharacterized protein LOC109770601 [Aegilops tauschii subsp. strangulata]XP_020184904.1 uncharacterized protein LOC109770601 [Aegilops tauschii subsp. strangulata]